jgi:hypothetical protein
VHRQALRLQETLLGKEHPDTVTGRAKIKLPGIQCCFCALGEPGLKSQLGIIPIGISCSPGAHPTHLGLTRASPSSRELRAVSLTRQNGKGNVQSSSPDFCSPQVIRVNRCTCRFGRYKNPRRPHPSPRPSPRVSWVSHHSPQVSALTLAHHYSPTAVRSTNRIMLCKPVLAPGQRGPNGRPRR